MPPASTPSSQSSEDSEFPFDSPTGHPRTSSDPLPASCHPSPLSDSDLDEPSPFRLPNPLRALPGDEPPVFSSSFSHARNDQHRIANPLNRRDIVLRRPPLLRNANPVIWTGPSPTQLLDEMMDPNAPVMAGEAPPQAPHAAHEAHEAHPAHEARPTHEARPAHEARLAHEAHAAHETHAAHAPRAPRAVQNIPDPYDFTLWAFVVLKLFLPPPAVLSHLVEHGIAEFPPQISLHVPTVLFTVLILVVVSSALYRSL